MDNEEIPEYEYIVTLVEVADANGILTECVWAFGMYRASGLETKESVSRALGEHFAG